MFNSCFMEHLEVMGQELERLTGFKPLDRHVRVVLALIELLYVRDDTRAVMLLAPLLRARFR